MRYRLHHDQVGSLIAVANARGKMIKRIEYDAFGNLLDDSNPYLRIPLGFAGGLSDPHTGLVRFGWRDYDPDTGRWTAKDPMGASGGDSDWYGYCLDDPVNGVDPSGLFDFRQRPLNFGDNDVADFLENKLAQQGGLISLGIKTINPVAGTLLKKQQNKLDDA
ncbi:RHS repeat domain-containing protein [Salidesulfovibrio brasiliensis]|uniref:RHS repeat domain-containing protein n=1 Tax=Salidesulfovibrio brasiliensis TaxID=221711 RepID=UPI001FE1DCA0|nr:RHS repeat-associated core domain-containing protein [Salidesulfovibrio brasiliensis]